ncbi:MAG: glycogen/starch synthase, partial [Oscillospiraceae bacterium]|nr:glycogen/starch synthase [Oscillospiraceae bacterium]
MAPPEAAAAPAEDAPAAEEAVPAAEQAEPAPAAETEEQNSLPSPRRSVAFIGAECYPFIKTGGLGDVMYALPRA